MTSPNTLNQLNRRTWLRDTALAATSVVVVPSMLIGCSDHRIPPALGVGPGLGGGIGEDVPLTNAELKSAAQNLLRMNAWVEDVYIYTGNYEQYVIDLVKSGQTPPSEYKNFIISILTDIAIGIIGAAAGVPVLERAIGAALAITSENIRKWTSGALPPTLAAEFAEFKLGHRQMQKTISTTLLTLADETDDYRNLREGWKGAIDFNGKMYTLRDLANSQFPTVQEGTAYVALRTAAYDRFRKYIWNLMIMKAGSMSSPGYWEVDKGVNSFSDTPTYHAREVFYKEPWSQSRYLRGYSEYVNRDMGSPPSNSYNFHLWRFFFDGRELPAAAAKELFKDDTPGHIINPDGLFNRDYVFKQFHREKPDFRAWEFGVGWGTQNYYDLRRDESWGGCSLGETCFGFDRDADNYVFTGGDFRQLIKK